jgi:8-oxo-dGTP pyrophosphatase MutT (NUDIX family)
MTEPLTKLSTEPLTLDSTELVTFGSADLTVQYIERRAAYVVVTEGGKVAAVVGAGGKFFLPGGGSLPGESPEETVAREVSEKLALGVRLTRKVGEAVQYFYAEADERYYRMRATFFAGEFTDEAPGGASEHELSWLSLEEVERGFFHACHAWAARQA